MYNKIKYERENITLGKELDRKKFEKDKVEVILYGADYEFLDSNKDSHSFPCRRSIRVAKCIYDSGQILHYVYGLPLENEPDNLKNFDSMDELDSVFWCAEENIWSEASSTGNVPCETYINGKLVNKKALEEHETE